MVNCHDEFIDLVKFHLLWRHTLRLFPLWRFLCPWLFVWRHMLALEFIMSSLIWLIVNPRDITFLVNCHYGVTFSSNFSELLREHQPGWSGPWGGRPSASWPRRPSWWGWTGARSSRPPGRSGSRSGSNCNQFYDDKSKKLYRLKIKKCCFLL